jgi:hypothetical protein
MILGIGITTPIALYVRFVGNPGLLAMALACLGAAVIVLALCGWRRNPGYAIELTGLTLNAIVILANGGRMPVVSYNRDDYGALWQPATADTRYVFLADQPFLSYASWGDVLIGLGLLVVVAYALAGRFRSRLPSSQPRLHA